MSPGIWGAHELRDWKCFLNVLTWKQGGPDEAVSGDPQRLKGPPVFFYERAQGRVETDVKRLP